ncbi:MAG: crossover junction endodeoxyribonuclease RuvC [Caldimicrobium sp.]|jgi:crossover junction endodeoxyribonuclease RuvC
MKILGVDPGLLNLGCVLIQIVEKDFEILRSETFKPKRDLEISKKLFYLYQALKKLIEEEQPDYVVLEEAIPKANPHSTVKVSQTSSLILLLSEEKGLPLKVYHPSYWKSFICGNGLAKKNEVLQFLLRLFKEKIDDKIRDTHQADALSLALVFALENNFLKF